MKSILITGCSSGVGKASAHMFASKGYRVFAGVRSEDDAQALRESDPTGNIEPVLLDLVNSSHQEAIVQMLSDRLGDAGLDGLINNAGVAWFSPLEFTDPDAIREMFEVNTMGPIILTQSLLPMLRKAHGCVVFVGSIAGKVAFPFNGPYSVSKFGIEAYADTLRREMRSMGVRVCLFEPGSIATPMMDKVEVGSEAIINGLSDEARALYETELREYLQTLPDSKGRAVEPGKLAEVIVRAVESSKPRPRYLVTPDARALIFLNWLMPDRWLDAIFSRMAEFSKYAPKSR